MESPHKEFDIVFVPDTLHEVYNKIGPLSKIIDSENKSTRPRLYKKSKGKISLIDKWNRNYNSKVIKDNDDLLATYGKRLVFLGDTIKSSISMQEFWIKTVQQIKIQKSIIEERSNDANKNFFFVTHHNRLKKTIFKDILDKKDKHHFANCTCVRIFSTFNNINERRWNFEIIFSGFPDKKEYNYFKSGKWRPNTKGIKFIELTKITTILDTIYDDKSDDNTVSIYIIRHGNAFHNLPLKLTGKGSSQIKKLPNRLTDSCLTPLGIFQATRLKRFLIRKKYLSPPNIKNFNIFSASILNRGQHTLLSLIGFKQYKNLLSLKNIFNKMAIFRLKRKLETDNKTLNGALKELSNSGINNGNPKILLKLLTKFVNKQLEWDKPYITFLKEVPSKHLNLPTYPIITELVYRDSNNRIILKGYVRKELFYLNNKKGGKTRKYKKKNKTRKNKTKKNKKNKY